MEGFIKISALENGIATEVSLKHFSAVDKLLLLNEFAKGLHMDDEDLKRGLLMLPLLRGVLANDKSDDDEGGDE